MTYFLAIEKDCAREKNPVRFAGKLELKSWLKKHVDSRATVSVSYEDNTGMAHHDFYGQRGNYTSSDIPMVWRMAAMRREEALA